MAHSFTGDNLIHTDGHIVNMTMADYQNLQSQLSRKEELLKVAEEALEKISQNYLNDQVVINLTDDTLLQIREARRP